MSLVRKTKEDIRPNAIPALLNELLANTIAFRLAAKQAHWNVKGESFIALHERFDKTSTAVDGYADMLAERVAQLDGTAEGTLEAVSRQSSLPAYPINISGGKDHILALSAAISELAETHRRAIDAAADAGDAVTADLVTEVTRGLDKLHWFIHSHAV